MAWTWSTPLWTKEATGEGHLNCLPGSTKRGGLTVSDGLMGAHVAAYNRQFPSKRRAPWKVPSRSTGAGCTEQVHG